MKRVTTAIMLGIATSQPASARIETRETPRNTVVAPFGFKSRQPPSSGFIKLPEVRLGLKAQQVCGFTDWSTVQLELPKQLLSKEYWKNVGEGLYRQAQRTVLDLSHALPSMLACNVSPTWCHVFNQAEMMAAFEGQLNFETCKIIDGLGEKSGILPTEALRQCMYVQTQQLGKSTEKARETCLRSGGGANEPGKQADAMERATKAGNPKRFSMNEFVKDLFPDKVKTTRGVVNFSSGNHRYTRREETATFMKELFPGLEVEASAKFRHGGTFQPSVTQEQAKEAESVKNAAIQILREMQRHKNEGYLPKDIIARSEHLWNNKEKWKQDGLPNPIYRATIDGSEPTFLIPPGQIYSLLPLAEDGFDSPMLTQVLDRISWSTAHVKVHDKLSDIFSRSMHVCRDPDKQDAVSQENCESIIARVKAEMEVLDMQLKTEERARKVQVEVINMVQSVQRERLSRMVSGSRTRIETSSRDIPLPTE